MKGKMEMNVKKKEREYKKRVKFKIKKEERKNMKKKGSYEN